jgi:hypothetical protein
MDEKDKNQEQQLVHLSKPTAQCGRENRWGANKTGRQTPGFDGGAFFFGQPICPHRLLFLPEPNL